MQQGDMREEIIGLGGGAHALATQILGCRELAADAVQDALLTVLRRPGSYDPARGRLEPWFLRIVRNRCLDLLRRRAREAPAPAELVDEGPGPEAAAERRQRDGALRAALAALAPEQREIIVLRDYLDLSYGEIAGVLAIPPGTVMSRLHRARLALRKAYLERHA